MTEHKQFHISYSPPLPNWPNGCYSLYEISGDEIAKRIGIDASGKVTFRDSWPGYICTTENFDDIAREIETRSRS